MAGERWRLGRRPGLDGLRGVAILLVIAAHTGKGLGYRSGGVAGVTLFFVLSGFLITSLLLEERDRTGGVDLRAFYARRARRLLPALGLVVIFVAFTYVALGASLRSLLPVVLYVANWPRAAGHEIGLMNHAWSLAIEEQFYLAWPLVMIVVRRRWLLRVTLAAAGVSVGLRFLLADGAARQDRVWFGTDTNAYALLAGCALAIWMSGRIAGPNRPRLAAGVCGALVLAGAYSTTAAYTFVVPLLAAAAGVALIFLICQSGSVGLFGSPVLRFIGRRSYGYYLWHVPILLLLETYGPTLTARLLVVPLTVGIPELSWRFVERPILKHKPAQAKGWIAEPSHQPLAVQSIG